MYEKLFLPNANYLFLSRAEDTASFLDILPKNYIIRLCVMAYIIAMLFAISYLPWLIKDLRTKKKAIAEAKLKDNKIKSKRTNTKKQSTEHLCQTL